MSRQYHFATQVTAAAGTASVTCGGASDTPAFRYDLAVIGGGANPVQGIFTANFSDGGTQAFTIWGDQTSPETIHNFYGPGMTAMTVSAAATCTVNAIIWW